MEKIPSLLKSKTTVIRINETEIMSKKSALPSPFQAVIAGARTSTLSTMEQAEHSVLSSLVATLKVSFSVKSVSLV